MFFKCLDCKSVGMDPELNTSQCPFCGSVNFAVVEEPAARPCPSQFVLTVTPAYAPKKRHLSTAPSRLWQRYSVR